MDSHQMLSEFDALVGDEGLWSLTREILGELRRKAEAEGLTAWVAHLDGRVAFLDKDFVKAEGLFRECLAQDPGHPLAGGDLGFALDCQDKWAEAAEAYERFAAQAAGDPSRTVDLQFKFILPELGDAYFQMGELDQAMTTFDRYLELVPDPVTPVEKEAWGYVTSTRGICLSRASRGQESLATFDEIIARLRREDDPAHKWQIGSALINKGAALADQGLAGEAQKLWQEAAELVEGADDPDSLDVYVNALHDLAHWQAKLYQPHEALANWQRAVEAGRSCPAPKVHLRTARAAISLGKALEQDRRAEEALEAFTLAGELTGGSKDREHREESVRAGYHQAQALARLDRREQALAILSSLLDSHSQNSSEAMQKLICPLLLLKGDICLELGDQDAALAAWREVVDRHGQGAAPVFAMPVAQALLNICDLLLAQDRASEALETCRNLEARLAGSHDEPATVATAKTLLRLARALRALRRGDEALQALNDLEMRFAQQVMEAGPKLLEVIYQGGNLHAEILADQGLSPEEIARSGGTLILHHDHPDADQTGAIHWVLRNRANGLAQAGKAAEAAALYEQAFDHYLSSGDPSLIPTAVTMLTSAAHHYVQLERYDDAIAMLSKLVSQVGDYTGDQEVEWDIYDAWEEKARFESQVGRYDQAMETYRGIIARYQDSEDFVLREHAAEAWGGICVNLVLSGRIDHTLTLSLQWVERYAHSDDLDDFEVVLSGLIEVANTLRKVGRSQEAAGMFDEVISRFQQDTDPHWRTQAAQALINKGSLLGELGGHAEAREALGQVAGLDGGGDHPPLKAKQAEALRLHALWAGRAGASDDALEMYRLFLVEYGDSPGLEIQIQSALGRTEFGCFLAEQGRHEEADRIWDEFLTDQNADRNPQLHHHLALAYAHKADWQRRRGLRPEALRTVDQAMKRFAGKRDTLTQGKTARAALVGVETLMDLQRYQESLEAVRNTINVLLQGFWHIEEKVRALYLQGTILNHLQRYEEAIGVWQELGDQHYPRIPHGVRNWLDAGLIGYAFSLEKIGHYQEAMECIVKILERAKNNQESANELHIAQALFHKARYSGLMGMHEQESDTRQEFLDIFGDRDEKEIRILINEARRSMAGIDCPPQE